MSVPPPRRARRPGGPKRRRRAVRVEAFAKLNLGLAVGPRRADGFHELATIFQSVTLRDTLEARPRASGFTLRVRHENVAIRGGSARARGVPAGRGNLVLKAARLASRALGLEGGAAFTLIKRIPARAGLGGGSADAAATIAALVRLNDLRVSSAAKMEIAAALGSDVPFALMGGTALGLGRGERLARLALARPFRAVIAVPKWRVSTANAYRSIDRHKYGLTSWPTKLKFANGLGRNGVNARRALLLGNTFEEVLGVRRSDFDSLCARLQDVGALAVRMTGSGSAAFGILGPGISTKEIAGRFAGSEALYVARSARSGMRFRKVP